MPNRIEELFAELAESAGGQQQFQMDQQLQQMEAQRQLHQTPEFRNALKWAGIIGLLALTRGRSGGKGLPLNKGYGAVGGDMAQQILSKVGSKLPGRSGSGVGADVAGRYALPKAKPSVVTKQGPRGPINIDSPKQLPLPLKGGRNTGGISATERAQLPQTGGGITATTEARKIQVQIKKLERWKRSHEAKVRRGEAEYQEGWRSGYEPDIKGGGKMRDNSMKRIREIQAELDELYKKL